MCVFSLYLTYIFGPRHANPPHPCRRHSSRRIGTAASYSEMLEVQGHSIPFMPEKIKGRQGHSFFIFMGSDRLTKFQFEHQVGMQRKSTCGFAARHVFGRPFYSRILACSIQKNKRWDAISGYSIWAKCCNIRSQFGVSPVKRRKASAA